MRRFPALLIVCVLPVTVSAQLDLNTLKREQDARAMERKQQSSQFQAERNARWGEFLDARQEQWAKTIANRDTEWTDFLSDSEWTVFDGFLTNKRPEEPKPDVVPQVETEPAVKPLPEPIVLPDEAIVTPEPEVPEEVEPEPLPCKPAAPEPEADRSRARLTFYGRAVSVPYDQSLKSYTGGKYTQKEIAAFWKTLSETDYTPTVTALIEEKDRIGLNDWGYYLLVNQFTQRLYADRNCSALLTWFILVRSGLDARVGYSNTGISLLLPTRTTLYDLNYVTMDGIKYYVVSNDTESGLRTYRNSYSGGHLFSFEQKKPLLLGGNNASRSLSFEFRGNKYTVDLNYDADLAEYYNALPQAQFEVYFGASPSVQLKQSIEANLRPVITGMDKPDALHFLLQFVQLSFDYKTDPQQFGHEKYFYADELLIYPYCDCEDRSVLFSYLAHELLGYDVVGTEFPGHMATAVETDYPVQGVKYTASGRTYTMADPTYIRASVGQCMSKYEKTTPIIHKIDFAK